MGDGLTTDSIGVRRDSTVTYNRGDLQEIANKITTILSAFLLKQQVQKLTTPKMVDLKDLAAQIKKNVAEYKQTKAAMDSTRVAQQSREFNLGGDSTYNSNIEEWKKLMQEELEKQEEEMLKELDEADTQSLIPLTE